MFIKRLLLAATLSLALASCETVSKAVEAYSAWDDVKGGGVSASDVQTTALGVRAGFSITLRFARQYSEWPRCGSPEAVGKTACSSQSAVDWLRKRAREIDVCTKKAVDVAKGAGNNPSTVNLALTAVAEARVCVDAFRTEVTTLNPQTR